MVFNHQKNPVLYKMLIKKGGSQKKKKKIGKLKMKTDIKESGFKILLAFIILFSFSSFLYF